MTPATIRYVLLCAALVGCRDKPPQTAKLSETLPTLLLPPNASFVERAAGVDALQITVRSPESADSVATYYRQILKKGGWRLVNDAKDADGATVLFAQRQGPPLWVRIRRDAEGSGSVVELTGAVVPKHDSTSAKPSPLTPSPAKPTS
jgi:hypothetical protein